MRKRLRDQRIWAGIGLGVNIVLLTVHMYLERRAHDLELMRLGDELVPLQGVALDGTLLPADSLNRRPCHLLRYGSQICPFSRMDLPLLEELRSESIARGCSDVGMAPAAQVFGRDAHNASVKLAFPAPELSTRPLFSSTPVTILIDANWRVAWFKVGSLDRRDVIGAVSAVRRLSPLSHEPEKQ